ncbi:MAG TPA: hypothetical protein VFE17_00115 [Candidatus Baltobacteraceae bacterium]|jgi:hypothetical protein|nr:hypothetical protein [Candidatus Baltobacteraceae bacterium]
MSLELLNTVASIGTFIVIGATALAAIVQLRHMRNNNQLTGLLDVLGRVEDPVFNEWHDHSKRIVQEQLPNQEFRRQIQTGTFSRHGNPWLNMMNSYEWVGSLVKHGLIPEEPFMDVYSARILRAWSVLEPVFAIARRGGDPSMWENFEYLVIRSRAWERQYPNGAYPKGVPRLEYRDVWLDEDRALGVTATPTASSFASKIS